MGAQKKVEGLVLSNLEKLPHVELDIMRNDENWEKWTYDQILEGLRKWPQKKSSRRHDNKK